MSFIELLKSQLGLINRPRLSERYAFNDNASHEAIRHCVNMMIKAIGKIRNNCLLLIVQSW